MAHDIAWLRDLAEQRARSRGGELTGLFPMLGKGLIRIEFVRDGQEGFIEVDSEAIASTNPEGPLGAFTRLIRHEIDELLEALSAET